MWQPDLKQGIRRTLKSLHFDCQLHTYTDRTQRFWLWRRSWGRLMLLASLLSCWHAGQHQSRLEWMSLTELLNNRKLAGIFPANEYLKPCDLLWTNEQGQGQASWSVQSYSKRAERAAVVPIGYGPAWNWWGGEMGQSCGGLIPWWEGTKAPCGSDWEWWSLSTTQTVPKAKFFSWTQRRSQGQIWRSQGWRADDRTKKIHKSKTTTKEIDQWNEKV